MGVIRPIGHAERLSIVDHLDELRTRLIWCLRRLRRRVLPLLLAEREGPRDRQQAARGVPAARQGQRPARAGRPLRPGDRPGARGPRAGAQRHPGGARGARRASRGSALRRAPRRSAPARSSRTPRGRSRSPARIVPDETGRRPVTLGVAEPFVVTFTVAGYAALLLSLPFILWQAYAFLLPAFDPRERRVAIPLMAMVPVLFVTGVLFGYYVALPRAVDFLQNFNDDSFDILIQARDYYRFVVVFLALMGLVFQVPVGVLALTRTGVVNARILWKNQGYVILGIAVLAAVVDAHARSRDDARDDGAAAASCTRSASRSRGCSGHAATRSPSRWGDWWDDDGTGEATATRSRPTRAPTARATTRLAPRTRPPAYPERMLFDLRGKGRRRTVQVIYLSLAILMGGGLVLFGIGGATSGGLFDAFSSDSGTQNVSSTYEKQVKTYTAKVRANPKDASRLGRAHPRTGPAGRRHRLRGHVRHLHRRRPQAAPAARRSPGRRYLDLDPKKPDGNLASLWSTRTAPAR